MLQTKKGESQSPSFEKKWLRGVTVAITTTEDSYGSRVTFLTGSPTGTLMNIYAWDTRSERSKDGTEHANSTEIKTY